MDELEGLYAKRNKPTTKREILYEFHLDELSRAIKIIEKVERWLPGAGRNGELVFNRDRVSDQEGEKFGRWMMVRVAQRCECTKCLS